MTETTRESVTLAVNKYFQSSIKNLLYKIYKADYAFFVEFRKKVEMKLKEAKEYSQKSLKECQNLEEKMANTYQWEEYEESLQYCNQALLHCPPQEEHYLASLYCCRALILLHLKNAQSSEWCRSQALHLVPNNNVTINTECMEKEYKKRFPNPKPNKRQKLEEKSKEGCPKGMFFKSRRIKFGNDEEQTLEALALIKRNSYLMKEKPMFFVKDKEQLQSMCAYCHLSGLNSGGFVPCPNCVDAVYCSNSCLQKEREHGTHHFKCGHDHILANKENNFTESAEAAFIILNMIGLQNFPKLLGKLNNFKPYTPKDYENEASSVKTDSEVIQLQVQNLRKLKKFTSLKEKASILQKDGKGK